MYIAVRKPLLIVWPAWQRVCLKISPTCERMPCFFFQAEDGIRDVAVTGVQTCALPISGTCEGWNRNHAVRPANGLGSNRRSKSKDLERRLCDGQYHIDSHAGTPAETGLGARATRKRPARPPL